MAFGLTSFFTKISRLLKRGRPFPSFWRGRQRLLWIALVSAPGIACPSALLAQAPTLSVISPSSATAGSPAFTLNLTGTNFNATSQVQWNGSVRPTSVLGATQLTASITASDVASSGVAQVTVFNPASGLTSNPQTFNIVPVALPTAAPLPTLIAVGPPLTTQGSQHLELTLRGTNFRPNASVTISQPLASVQLSQANQPASDIAVESVTRLNSSLMIAVISVDLRAAPGLRAVDVVNSDATNTSSQTGLGSATSKPLSIALSNSLAAPLSIQTIALMQPRDGMLVAQADDVFGEAILAGTGSGVVTGEWVWDNAVSEQFAVNMTGGERIALRSRKSLPTLSLGPHTVQLRITAPNLLESRAVQIVINPGAWRSMRLLAPPPGSVFAADAPPLLRWLPVAGASYYEVGLSSKPYFSSIETWHEVTDSQWRMDRQVWSSLKEGDLYWTVRTVDGSGERKRPLPMRRLTKYPVKAAAKKPETHGPTEPWQADELTAGQDHEAQAQTVRLDQSAASGTDAESESQAPSSGPQQPPVEAPQHILQTSQTQLSSNTQWASGSAADINILALAQQTSFQNGPWRVEINSSGLLNSLLAPEPRHSFGRANDYLFRLGYDRPPHLGANLRFGVLAPSLYIGSEFVSTVAPRQGVEPSLRTPGGTLAFWTNTIDAMPGAGVGATFHQKLMGGSYEAPLPQNRAVLRLMWLNARDEGLPLASSFQSQGTTVIAPSHATGSSSGDIYGGLLQLHLGAQWLWQSEYSWSYSDPESGVAGSAIQFGRAWRSGISGIWRQTQIALVYRDVGPSFLNPANPGLGRSTTPGRRGTDITLSRPFHIGTFTAGYQYLQSDVGLSGRPPLSLHNLTGGWSRSLTAMTVLSLQAHEVRTFTSSPANSSASVLAAATDTRDLGLNASLNRTFKKLVLGFMGSRDWFRNHLLNGANVITSNVGLNANYRAASFLQLNSNFSVNWVAADKNSLGGTRVITLFLQPMVQWQRTGLSVSPLITVGQTRTLLATGLFTADNLSTQYGGRLGWQLPRSLKFNTLSFEGGAARLRNGITGAEQNELRLIGLWTVVLAHGHHAQ